MNFDYLAELNGLYGLYDALVSLDEPNELIVQGCRLSAYLASEKAKSYKPEEKARIGEITDKINRYLDYLA